MRIRKRAVILYYVYRRTAQLILGEFNKDFPIKFFIFRHMLGRLWMVNSEECERKLSQPILRYCPPRPPPIIFE